MTARPPCASTATSSPTSTRCSTPSAERRLGLPPPPPAAAVFDNDGLLVDTEGLWTKAEEKLFAAHGRRFAPEHKREMVGWRGRGRRRSSSGCSPHPDAGPSFWTS